MPTSRTNSALLRPPRKHSFTASSFAVIRLEDPDEIERLKEDLVSVYQPINSQELFAIERIALAQQALLRGARLESGIFTACLNHALVDEPEINLLSEEITSEIEVTRQQNRNFCLAEGLHRISRHSNAFGLILRYQAQAERHYRRAIEEFERLKKLRPVLPTEDVATEPISPAQPEQTEAASPDFETSPSSTATPADCLSTPSTRAARPHRARSAECGTPRDPARSEIGLIEACHSPPSSKCESSRHDRFCLGYPRS